MEQPGRLLRKSLLENALNWFQPQIRNSLAFPIEGQFPNHGLPPGIQAVLRSSDFILQVIKALPDGDAHVEGIVGQLATRDRILPQYFKQIILFYRRHRAAETERLTEKTVHLELAESLEKDINALDALVGEDWFQRIESLRLPRLKDFIPVQYIESAAVDPVPFATRQYDEKFHILQAPHLFLPDLAFLRSKCEDREVPLAVAFLDIDHFKAFNTEHREPKVDRNLLPRFMQAIEAHVFQHGYAYKQGGEEYLIIVPGLSRALSIAFLDELRCKLADLEYPEIKGRTTVSIGLCVVEPDCPFTDRELRDFASVAEKFAKENGRNCIATFQGPRFIAQDLHVVRPEPR